MATKLEQTFSIDAPPQAVVAAIRNPSLIEESERSRGALEVRIEQGTQTEAKHEYTVHTVTYARGLTGLDKSKTESNRNDISWDLSQARGSWNFKGVHGNKVKVAGGYAVTANGSGSSLRLFVEADISIPLMGKSIEKKVKEGFEKGWPAYVELVRKYAKQA